LHIDRKAKDIGEKAYDTFRAQRIESNPASTQAANFHAKMTKAKLKRIYRSQQENESKTRRQVRNVKSRQGTFCTNDCDC